MNIIKLYWTQYKFAFLAVLFLIACAFTWNISSKVKGNEFNAERIRLLNQTIEAQKSNEKLKDEITRTFREALASSQAEIQIANRKAVSEILSDPRYRTCTITPGVRNAYRDAIAAQSGAAAPAANGKVSQAASPAVR